MERDRVAGQVRQRDPAGCIHRVGSSCEGGGGLRARSIQVVAVQRTAHGAARVCDQHSRHLELIQSVPPRSSEYKAGAGDGGGVELSGIVALAQRLPARDAQQRVDGFDQVDVTGVNDIAHQADWRNARGSTGVQGEDYSAEGVGRGDTARAEGLILGYRKSVIYVEHASGA